MNTKLIMTASAFFLGGLGIIFTFAPDLVLEAFAVESNAASILLGQFLGALYFGFGMLNWMAKGSLIGGIYNRPIAIANLSHFMIAALALTKALISGSGFSTMVWAVTGVYVVFAVLFGIIFFRHPISSQKDDK